MDIVYQILMPFLTEDSHDVSLAKAARARRKAHEPAPLGGGGLLHHFLGNGKPWQNRLFASPADARAYDRHHEGRLCEWWALLASWRREAGGASRNSTCWRAFEAPGKFSVSTLSTHARALCPARRRGRM